VTAHQCVRLWQWGEMPAASSNVLSFILEPPPFGDQGGGWHWCWQWRIWDGVIEAVIPQLQLNSEQSTVIIKFRAFRFVLSACEMGPLPLFPQYLTIVSVLTRYDAAIWCVTFAAASTVL
jgi:hypothetical protein